MFGFGEFGGPDCRRCGGYYPGNPGAYSGYWCRCKKQEGEKKERRRQALNSAEPQRGMRYINVPPVWL